MTKRMILGASVAAVAVIGMASDAHADLLAINFTSGNLYTVNPTTGAASAARASGLINVAGITTRPGSNTVFALLTNGSLYTVDPVSGAGTLVGATGVSFSEGDIAYDPSSGFLYGLMQSAIVNDRRVYRIDPATAAATYLGSTANTLDVSAAAFAPDGTLYALDTGGTTGLDFSKLLTIDKTNGSLLTSRTMNADLGSLAGLAFDPVSGQAYVADGAVTGSFSLYRLSTLTGQVNTAGALGVNGGASGLTFATVPEPAAAVVWVAGLAVGLRRRRK